MTKQWLMSNKDPEKCLSAQFQQQYNNSAITDQLQQPPLEELPYIHRSCYSRITNKVKLDRALLNAADKVRI